MVSQITAGFRADVWQEEWRRLRRTDFLLNACSFYRVVTGVHTASSEGAFPPSPSPTRPRKQIRVRSGSSHGIRASLQHLRAHGTNRGLSACARMNVITMPGCHVGDLEADQFRAAQAGLESGASSIARCVRIGAQSIRRVDLFLTDHSGQFYAGVFDKGSSLQVGAVLSGLEEEELQRADACACP